MYFWTTLEFRIIGGVGIIGGGLNNVIIINNRGGGWNNRGGWTGLKKVWAVAQYLYGKLNTTLYYFFLRNGHIYPIQFNSKKLRNDGI